MIDEGTNSPRENTLHRRDAIAALLASARYLAGHGTKIVIITLRDGDPAGISINEPDVDVPPLAILGPGGDYCLDILAETKGTPQ